MALLKKFKTTQTIDTKTYTFFFLAPPDHYEGLETEAGVDVAAADEQSMPVTSMQEMLLSPVMTRRTLVHGTETRRKRTKIAIATSKAATFDAAAIDKTYKGSKIVKVTEPLDASYS